MRALIRISMLTLAFLIGTAMIGWWTVPLLAALWGVLAFRVPRAGVVAGFAAALAWALLLAFVARTEAFPDLLRSLGGVIGIPAASLIALTLIFPALLGWSAARVTAVLMTLLRGRPSVSQPTDGDRVSEPSEMSSAGDRPREVYASK